MKPVGDSAHPVRHCVARDVSSFWGFPPRVRTVSGTLAEAWSHSVRRRWDWLGPSPADRKRFWQARTTQQERQGPHPFPFSQLLSLGATCLSPHQGRLPLASSTGSLTFAVGVQGPWGRGLGAGFASCLQPRGTGLGSLVRASVLGAGYAHLTPGLRRQRRGQPVRRSPGPPCEDRVYSERRAPGSRPRTPGAAVPGPSLRGAVPETSPIVFKPQNGT